MDGVATETREGKPIAEPEGRDGRERGRARTIVILAGVAIIVGAVVASFIPVRVSVPGTSPFRCGVSFTRLTNPEPESRWGVASLELVLRHRLDAHGPLLTTRCRDAIDHRVVGSGAALGIGAVVVAAGAFLLRPRTRSNSRALTRAAPRAAPTATVPPDHRVRARVTLDYVPGLDGIRAVAVIAVLAFHAGLAHTQGGFLGVDTFFVLSGYLITTLLVTEWRRTSTVGLRIFWARRARRLLPALFLVVAAVTIWWSFFGDLSERPGLRFDALATLGYSANWRFIFAKAGYFDPAQAMSPLRHMWSLAVEEQFYLIWPLVVLLVLRRWSLRVLAVVTGVLAIASATLMAVLYRPASVSRAYFGTDTRVHVLLTGALLALALPWLVARPAWHRAISVAGFVGAAFMLWAFTTVDGETSFLYRGGSFAFALAAAAVVATAVVLRDGPVARALSMRPLRAIGRVSYGVYLWHWPVFLALNHARTGLSVVPLLAVRVAATAVLAAASFRFVERPIRQGALGRRALTLAPLSLVVVACIAVRATFPAVPQQAAHRSPFDFFATAPAAHHVLLVGDSVAFTLSFGLPAGPGFDYVGRASIGCGILPGDIRILGQRHHNGCADNVRIWQSDIASVRPSVVAVLLGRWEVRDHRIGGRWIHIGQPEFDGMVSRRIDRLIAAARQHGSRVALLTAPYFHQGEQPDGRDWPEDDPRRVDRFNRLLRDAAARDPADVVIVDINAVLCPHGRYERVVDGRAVRRSDGVHTSAAGTSLVAPVLERGIEPLLPKSEPVQRPAAG